MMFCDVLSSQLDTQSNTCRIKEQITKKTSNRNKAEAGVSVNELVSYLQGRWRRVETGEAVGQVSAELMREVRTGVWVGVAGR